MSETLLIVLAVSGWLVAIVAVMMWKIDHEELKRVDKENFEYFIKLHCYLHNTFKIMKDWHLEGGFVCDESFMVDFERAIWRDDKN